MWWSQLAAFKKGHPRLLSGQGISLRKPEVFLLQGKVGLCCSERSLMTWQSPWLHAPHQRCWCGTLENSEGPTLRVGKRDAPGRAKPTIEFGAHLEIPGWGGNRWQNKTWAEVVTTTDRALGRSWAWDGGPLCRQGPWPMFCAPPLVCWYVRNHRIFIKKVS